MALVTPDWIEMRPSLPARSKAERAFRQCWKELAAIVAEGRDLQRVVKGIRGQYLGRLTARDQGTVKGRVAISVLGDLCLQGWVLQKRGRRLGICSPESLKSTPALEKERVQAAHLLERDAQLLEPSTRRFIEEMERLRLFQGDWVSIFSLMRDGVQFANQLDRISKLHESERATRLKQVIAPYIQVVDADAKCQFTGFRLMDIWRYFRHTWTTSYQSTPGRSMAILVRDAAVDNHPVIGIAAVGSAVVQLRIRDDWIGWSSKQFLDELDRKPSKKWAEWLQEALVMAKSQIHVRDLVADGVLASSDLKRPTQAVVSALREEAASCRKAHVRHWRSGHHKAPATGPERLHWRSQSESYLFRSKRARALGELLQAQLRLDQAGFHRPRSADLECALGDPRGRAAIQKILRFVKAMHVGVDMLDITVCGAIDPYRPILGGKLISLLMASPEVVAAYESRYQRAVSQIASGMAGKAVRRRPHLVLLGTTSLYGVHASQYNRIAVKVADLGVPGSGEIRFRLLGRSEGFGSYQFSASTLAEMKLLLRRARGGRRVNSIFGEGVNPKLRKVREALDAAGLPAEFFLRHGSPRLVYGLALASNFREVLIGCSRHPRYYLPKRVGRGGTERLAGYWTERWVTRRIARNEVVAAVASNSLTHPIRHGARAMISNVDGQLHDQNTTEHE